MNMPIITFNLITFEQNMDLIAMFLEYELNHEIKPNTAYFETQFPVIQSIDYTNMNSSQISAKLKLVLYDEWKKLIEPYKKIVSIYQNNWNEINNSVMTDLSNKLNISWPEDSLDIQAFVGILYTCPRNVSNRRFYIAGDSEIDRMREVTVHEICHFLYFEKWKELFNDYDESHYVQPHIIWHLSEALIDPLLNNEQFLKYTNRNIPSYEIFYEKEINNKSIIDNLREIVDKNTIEEAIKKSYELFLNNEEAIKNQER